MNKIISKITLSAIFAANFLAVFNGSYIYASKAITPEEKPAITVSPIKKGDKRVVALKNVLEKNNSPLAPYAKDYVKSADKYGVDWRLLPSIAGLESSFGKRLMPGSHNGYGWGGGHIYFSSWEEGIDKINSSLASRYYARGATDVWSIGPIYAESPTWAVRVNSFMSQIDAELAYLGTQEVSLTI